MKPFRHSSTKNDKKRQLLILTRVWMETQVTANVHLATWTSLCDEKRIIMGSFSLVWGILSVKMPYGYQLLYSK